MQAQAADRRTSSEDNGGYYYVAYADLNRLIPADYSDSISYPEFNEIDELRRIVEQVTQEPPRFFTTT